MVHRHMDYRIQSNWDKKKSCDLALLFVDAWVWRVGEIEMSVEWVRPCGTTRRPFAARVSCAIRSLGGVKRDEIFGGYELHLAAVFFYTVSLTCSLIRCWNADSLARHGFQPAWALLTMWPKEQGESVQHFTFVHKEGMRVYPFRSGTVSRSAMAYTILR